MFTIKGDKFYLNDKPIVLRSGAMHYFRVPKEYWEDRLKKLKAMGLNTVETYVAWNLHEKTQGEYDFNDMLDIHEFILLAKSLSLYVIIRPGPYICAEFDNGGFPAYLYKDKNVVLRSSEPTYLEYVKSWFTRLFEEFSDLQISKGGNVIAMQIENEYGSYGSDKAYLKALVDMYKELGIDCLLFTADGGAKDAFTSGGSLPEIYKTLTFGSTPKTAFDCLNGIETGPKCCMEFWVGWFDNWLTDHHSRPVEDVMKDLQYFIDNDISFNLYMFTGGTNFSFTAGANLVDEYLPTITSYDYGAPLGEYGNYTPLYHAIRKSILKRDRIKEEDLPLPSEVKTQNVGAVKLTKSASLLSNLDNISKPIKSHVPLSFADMGMTNGYAFYSTKIKGKYTLAPYEMAGLWTDTSLTLCNLNDLGYLYIDGKFNGRYWRNDAKRLHKFAMHSVELGDFNGEKKIDLLVDAMGGVNYGAFMGEQKGIEALMISQQFVYDWECRALDMNKLESLDFDGKNQVPCFLMGEFTAKKQDCFVKLDGFTKGFVVVNGKNLGRYWNIGPQKTLYLPGCYLNDGINKIIVFEQEGYHSPQIEIIDHPILDGAVSKA